MPADLPAPHVVAAASRGAPPARAALLDACVPVVLGWCRRLGGRGVSPEDATHDVLVVVLERLVELRDPAAFPAWLFQITRRVLATHRRRSWVRRGLSVLRIEPVDPGVGPAGRQELSERAAAVRDLLDELPEAQRLVLVLMDVEGRRAPEVAALLAVPEGTVRSRLRLARARFRARTEARGEEVVLLLAGGEP